MNKTEAKDILNYDIRQYVKQCEDATDEDIEALDLVIEMLQETKVSEDCIGREWVLNKLNEQYKVNRFEEHNDMANEGINQAESIVQDAPSVVPTTEQSSEVGEWIRDRYWSRGTGMGEEYGFFYKCSLCEYEVEDGYTRCGFNYCPNCGAKMKGADDE